MEGALRYAQAGCAWRTALEAIADGKPHVVVLRSRAWLRFAHATGYWGDVDNVRALLAGTYWDTAEELAESAGDRYLDVRSYLAAPTYLCAATAFRVLA